MEKGGTVKTTVPAVCYHPLSLAISMEEHVEWWHVLPLLSVLKPTAQHCKPVSLVITLLMVSKLLPVWRLPQPVATINFQFIQLFRCQVLDIAQLWHFARCFNQSRNAPELFGSNMSNNLYPIIKTNMFDSRWMQLYPHWFQLQWCQATTRSTLSNSWGSVIHVGFCGMARPAARE